MAHMLSNISYKKGIGEIKKKKNTIPTHTEQGMRFSISLFSFFFFNEKNMHSKKAKPSSIDNLLFN